MDASIAAEWTAQVGSSGGEAVMAMADALIAMARRQGASDLYLEPTRAGYRVRVRRDGILEEVEGLAPEVGQRLIARLKVMARLAVHRTMVPQEGRIASPDPSLEIRMSVVPTIHGERAVLRLAAGPGTLLELSGLGLEPGLLGRYRALLALPQGAVFVCGPSGSGKTTTLYASVGQIEATSGDRRAIVTLEDPVERSLHGVAQTEVNPQAGLDFATGLRALLRQDPDVLMIGEVRDPETCRIALQAALTGHLVLSSMHTSDALEALERLRDLGADPAIVACSVRGILAQRLLRRVCPACVGTGCPACGGSGLSGRIAVGELLVLGGRLRALVRDRARGRSLARAAAAAGLRPLAAAAGDLVDQGITTASEVARCLGPDTTS